MSHGHTLSQPAAPNAAKVQRMESDVPQPPDASIRNARYSDSPQRWTRVTKSIPSPVRSVHPEHSVNRMGSINSQVDFGHRNTDFFDADSSDDEPVTARKASILPSLETEERPISPVKRKSKGPPFIKPFVSQCEPKGGSEDWPLQPDDQGYQRLESNLAALAPLRTSTPSTTYSGSVDEFAEFIDNHDAARITPKRPKSTQNSSARTPRSSGNWKSDHRRSGEGGQTVYDPRLSTYSDKVEQRLGIHAIAHEVYLQGLFRDEELLNQHKISPIAPARVRESLLPSSLRSGPPRGQPTIPARPALSTSDSALGSRGPAKKVHLVPPPIDLSRKHSLPEDIVRTPYPFGDGTTSGHDRDRSTTSTAPLEPTSITDAQLTLSIHRAPKSTAKLRVTTIPIPTPSSYSVLPNTTPSNRPYDDAAFFLALRDGYATLLPLAVRLFSARSIRAIRVSQESGAQGGQIQLFRTNPKTSGSFDDEQALAGFKKPKLGRGQSRFVSWAQALHGESVPPIAGPSFGRVNQPVTRAEEPVFGRVNTPPVDAGYAGREEEDEIDLGRSRTGIEFVIGWSWRRILLAVVVVALSAVAAVLLWVFLGTESGGAGNRVGTAAALGIVGSLVEMGLVGAWLGISWVVV